MLLRLSALALLAALAATGNAADSGTWSGLPSRLPLYTPVGAFPCTVLTHADGWVGCRSMSTAGQSGRLWPLLTAEAAKAFLAHDYPSVSTSTDGDGTNNAGVAPPSGDLVVVLSSLTFSKEVVDQLLLAEKMPEACQRCGSVEGVVVLSADSSTRPDSFSIADPYPQHEFSLYPTSKRAWNPFGSSWMWSNYTKPVWLLMSTDQAAENGRRNNINDLLVDWDAASAPDVPVSSPDVEFAAITNRDDKKASPPQTGVSLRSFMQAAATTEICSRRSQCQALGSWNVWAAPGQLSPAAKSEKKIIYVVAGADSNAFFRDVSPGARSAVSGAVAALAAAVAIQNSGFADKLQAMPVFALFEAESWGYVGSRAFVRDVGETKCADELTNEGRDCPNPYVRNWNELSSLAIDTKRVQGIIELNQVGRLSGGQFFVHSEQGPQNGPLFSALARGAEITSSIQSTQYNIRSASSDELPPSSIMSFLRKERALASVVLTEYDQAYTNRFFHNRFDDYSNLDVETVCAASQVVATAVWHLSEGSVNESVARVDCEFVKQLVSCLTQSYNCPLARSLLFPPEDVDNADLIATLPPSPTQYSSVYSQKTLHSISVAILHNALFDRLRYAASGICTQDSDCDATPNLPTRCIRGACLNSNVFYHDAQSAEMQWAESDWSQMYVSMFQMDAPASEIMLLVGGIVVCLASVGSVWWSQRFFSQRLKLN